MTVRQKQLLLSYFGLYDGEIDGKWGPLSEEATRRFQEAVSLDPDGIFGPATEARIREVIAAGENLATKEESDDFWADIKHFTREEFACKCGHCGGFPAEPREKLIRVADRVREHFGSPVIVSSGVRCEAHNAAVGGVKNSRHLSGKAMDFCVTGFSAAMVLAYVQQQKEIRYAYAIDSNFVHMDIE